MRDLLENLERAHLPSASVTAMLQLSNVLSAARSLEDITQHVPELARRALGADFAAVGVRELDGQHLRYLALEPASLPEAIVQRWHRVPLSVDSPPTHAARDGRATFFATAEEAITAYPQLAGQLQSLGYAATVNVPLAAAGKLLGVFGLAWLRERHLSEIEREVLGALAGFTAQAVDRLQMAAERRSTTELLQRSLLTRLPQPAGLELGARYLAAAAEEQIGGDWYDALILPDGSTTVVIGDVTGHDMRAAALMGQLRSLLRAFAWDRDESPPALVSRLERAMEGLDVRGMATAVLARIEHAPGDGAAGARQIRWTNAGHLPPALLYPDGGTRLLQTSPDLVVGFDPTTTRAEHRHPLPPGATLLLYTDGLIERRDRSLADGMADLCAALSRHRDLTLDDLLDTLVAELAGPHPQDDVALLAIRAA
jgi:serine phosphatase RsbU (regulator of sigma subunit)